MLKVEVTTELVGPARLDNNEPVSLGLEYEVYLEPVAAWWAIAEAEEVYFELPLPADDVNKRSTAAIVAADEATIGKVEPLTRLVIGGA